MGGNFKIEKRFFVVKNLLMSGAYSYTYSAINSGVTMQNLRQKQSILWCSLVLTIVSINSNKLYYPLTKQTPCIGECCFRPILIQNFHTVQIDFINISKSLLETFQYYNSSRLVMVFIIFWSVQMNRTNMNAEFMWFSMLYVANILALCFFSVFIWV